MEHQKSAHFENDNQLIVKDHLVSGKTFVVRWNPDQQLAQTLVPKTFDASSYYDSQAYDSHKRNRTGIQGLLYSISQKIMFHRKLKVVIPFLHKANDVVLDYGCGTGTFVDFLHQKKYKCIGVEPYAKARTIAKDRGLPVYESLDTLPKANIKVIVLWHVLEHVDDPIALLQTFYQLLPKSGALILALPNLLSQDAQHYQQDWAAFDVPRHLWHFSKPGIVQMTEKQGFTHKKTHKMPLDAYYVSMLSEKNKGNRFSFVQGLLRGARSNISAIKTGEYSSLMYVFQKN
ncbi:MAG: class I SAM-dependent methyltransferase [Flavobacteriaceae bacterium]